ncbi:MAG TPA: hypothetical protein VKS81_08945, partial [Bacteroidota bacterium]|nr:hypothetical protein [Bacteroidota bacterium]
SLLADNMQLTVLVGNAYKKNPDHVLHKADSLNAVLTAQNTQANADWQQNINSDPEAQQDFEQAAQDYAEQSGYQPDEITTPLNPDAVAASTTPYNWWFGYPRWYPYAYWDPYPYWYDWGFYYGPGHHAIFFGSPSAAFMNWYFYYPEHHVRYAHLSNVYYNYFDAHRHSDAYNPIVHSVRTWRRSNADVISPDWDKNPGKREQLFKEYGAMEVGRSKYNQKHPDKQVQRQDYVKTHVQKFPDFASTPNRAPGQQRGGYQPPVQQMPPPVIKPYQRVPDSFKVNVTPNRTPDQRRQNTQQQNNPPQQNNTPPQHNPPPNVRTTNTRPQVSNDVRTANQFHQGSWQQIQPEQRPVVQQQPLRVVQQQPQRQPERQNNPPPPPRKR